MIKIKYKDFGIDLKNNYELFFKHNNKEYKVTLRDVCDALAEQRFIDKGKNTVEKAFISECRKGYSLALQELKWNILEQVQEFEVEESNFTLGEIVTYKDNFVEPFNINLEN
jgi:hypothetical protein